MKLVFKRENANFPFYELCEKSGQNPLKIYFLKGVYVFETVPRGRSAPDVSSPARWGRRKCSLPLAERRVIIEPVREPGNKNTFLKK